MHEFVSRLFGRIWIRRMLIRFSIALAFSVAGALAADAADLSSGQNVSFSGYAAYAYRAEPVIIYDYQPGVIVRTYWDAPWNNRHYFPKTGHRPKSGRLEHFPKHRVSKAEDYFRVWATSSRFPVAPPPPFFPMSAATGIGSPYGAAPLRPAVPPQVPPME